MWAHLHYEILAEAVNLLNEEEEKRRLLQSVYKEEQDIENVLSSAGWCQYIAPFQRSLEMFISLIKAHITQR